MRIITGKRRGLKLLSPKGQNTRPTESRIKESLFNILGNVSGSTACDLFAGSGAIGLEFLSRDAKEVYFIENNKEALDVLKKNIKKANLSGFQIIENDYKFAIEKMVNLGKKFDYVYIDPPYDKKSIYNDVLKIIYNTQIFEDSLIIVESDKDVKIDNIRLFNILDERNYRNTKLYFLRRM